MTHLHLALVGMPGSGKSATAVALSEATGTATVDLDDLVALRTGAPAAQIIRDRGEADFRAAEAEALADALDAAPVVVACGGGVVMTGRCREILRRPDVVTVWLTATPATAATRIGLSSQDRPLLDEPGAYDRLWHERRRHFMSVADVVVATDRRAPAEVAAIVLARLGAAPLQETVP